MKKIIAMLLVVLMAVALFSGCTAKEITDEIENLHIANVGEAVPEETETAAEASTETETETDTEKTTETTTAKSTAQSTTAKETTTKKAETTTKSTTTKPSAATSHSHDWKAHYSERKVLVKEAWDEPDYWVDQYHTHTTGLVCKDCDAKFGFTCNVCGYFYAYDEFYDGSTDDYGKSPTGNSAWEDADRHEMKTGHHCKTTGKTVEWIDIGYYAKGKHHDAEYKTEKYIDYYYCSCGAKKNA